METKVDHWDAFGRRFRRTASKKEGPVAITREKAIAAPVGPLRGGRKSAAWGKPVAWMNGKVPAGTAALLQRLAEGHDLHRWQVLVEALDCFKARHGLGQHGKGDDPPCTGS
jgi:hypothetical protein